MKRLSFMAALLMASTTISAFAQDSTALKAELSALVDGKAKLTQEIVDSVFSFAEVGFNEYETMRYLTGMLEEAGFTIETGVGGMPTAWIATWSNGEGPAISFNSDVDGLPGQSQMPGVLEKQPMVEGAGGHGEGHNTGIAVSVTAALAVKELMEAENLGGTLQVWPGIAEEALAAKQWFVAAGAFDDIDVVLSNHVGNGLSTSWGQSNSMSVVSAEYSFTGTSAHGAVSPWSGRSALDAVELMNVGWNYRREHMHPNQRSHYVITDGGLQPNIVPDKAAVWYYFRHTSPEAALEMLEIADAIAEGATLMTGTKWERRVLGSGWPSHGNRALAEAMYANIEAIGMPEWSEDDQAYARAVQESLGSEPIGLRTEIGKLAGPVEQVGSGASDDIGAVMWTVPTIRLSYPANIAGTTIHNWQAALAEATPIAHKGALTGAKVTALTALDVLLDPELVTAAKAYFTDVQTKDIKYFPFESETDVPSTHLNPEAESFRALQEPFYYDPSKHETYLEQLGIEYPQLAKPAN